MKIPVSGVKPDIQDDQQVPKSIIVCGSGFNQDWRKRVKEIVFPVRFDHHGTHFFDADGKMIAQVRGWGGLTSSGVSPEESADIQTKWGLAIAEAINACPDLFREEAERHTLIAVPKDMIDAVRSFIAGEIDRS